MSLVRAWVRPPDSGSTWPRAGQARPANRQHSTTPPRGLSSHPGRELSTPLHVSFLGPWMTTPDLEKRGSRRQGAGLCRLGTGGKPGLFPSACTLDKEAVSQRQYPGSIVAARPPCLTAKPTSCHGIGTIRGCKRLRRKPQSPRLRSTNSIPPTQPGTADHQ